MCHETSVRARKAIAALATKLTMKLGYGYRTFAQISPGVRLSVRFSVTFSVQAASLQALCDRTLAPQLCDLVGRISDVRKNLVRVLTERW